MYKIIINHSFIRKLLTFENIRTEIYNNFSLRMTKQIRTSIMKYITIHNRPIFHGKGKIYRWGEADEADGISGTNHARLARVKPTWPSRILLAVSPSLPNLIDTCSVCRRVEKSSKKWFICWYGWGVVRNGVDCLVCWYAERGMWKECLVCL